MSNLSSIQKKLAVFLIAIMPEIIAAAITVELVIPGECLDTLTKYSQKFIDPYWSAVDSCFLVTTPSLITNRYYPIKLLITSTDSSLYPIRYPLEIEYDSTFCCLVVASWEDASFALPEHIWRNWTGAGGLWYLGCGTIGIPTYPAILTSLDARHWHLILATWEAGTTNPDSFPLQLMDDHPEELFVTSFCNGSGECIGPLRWNSIWRPQLGRYYSPSIGVNPNVAVVADYFCPLDSISLFDTIRVDICSGGCHDTAIFTVSGVPFYRYHFLLDSTSAWLTMQWDGGTDTVYYGDPGTFWYQPDELPIPWRRFGVLTDSTDLPSDYEGDVTVCLQDATNAPVIAYGEPIHLHPRRVNPFLHCEGHYGAYCNPSPPEPVCWSFTIIPEGIHEPQEQEEAATTLDLSISGMTLKYVCPEGGELIIYDVLGKIVSRRNVSGTGAIKIGELTDGVYFAKLRNGKEMIKRMMIVK